MKSSYLTSWCSVRSVAQTRCVYHHYYFFGQHRSIWIQKNPLRGTSFSSAPNSAIPPPSAPDITHPFSLRSARAVTRLAVISFLLLSVSAVIKARAVLHPAATVSSHFPISRGPEDKRVHSSGRTCFAKGWMWTLVKFTFRKKKKKKRAWIKTGSTYRWTAEGWTAETCCSTGTWLSSAGYCWETLLEGRCVAKRPASGPESDSWPWNPELQGQTGDTREWTRKPIRSSETQRFLLHFSYF